MAECYHCWWKTDSCRQTMMPILKLSGAPKPLTIITCASTKLLLKSAEEIRNLTTPLSAAATAMITRKINLAPSSIEVQLANWPETPSKSSDKQPVKILTLYWPAFCNRIIYAGNTRQRRDYHNSLPKYHVGSDIRCIDDIKLQFRPFNFRQHFNLQYVSKCRHFCETGGKSE